MSPTHLKPLCASDLGYKTGGKPHDAMPWRLWLRKGTVCVYMAIWDPDQPRSTREVVFTLLKVEQA